MEQFIGPAILITGLIAAAWFMWSRRGGHPGFERSPIDGSRYLDAEAIAKLPPWPTHGADMLLKEIESVIRDGRECSSPDRVALEDTILAMIEEHYRQQAKCPAKP